MRLLKFKGYIDLSVYASRGTPPLLLNEVTDYVPAKKDPSQTSWDGVFTRLLEFEDDGHGVKFGRAVANAKHVSKAYEGEPGAKVKGGMWEKVANMVVDSVEDTGATWVRGVGFDEAWTDYEDRRQRE